jgi:hypothetical protein
VTRQDRRLVRQRKNFLVNSTDQQLVVASRQVGPADTSRKEYIAAEKNLVICRVETEASRTMSRNKKNAKRDAEQFNGGCFLNQKIRLNGFRFQKEPEIFEEFRVGDEGNSISVIGDLAAESSFQLCGVINVVDMAVSDQQQVKSYRQISHPIRGARRRIDENVPALHPNQIGVRIENTPNKRLKVKHSE